MTRITFSLLRFDQPKGGEMLSPKTHFEQVPLEVVKQIVAKQVQNEELAVDEAKQKYSTKLSMSQRRIEAK
jgi:hypothetical protein